MSDLIDIPAALVASPRPCAPVVGARLFADDARLRLLGRPETTATRTTWRHLDGSAMRGSTTAAQHTTQDGRTADGVAYVADKQHFSTRSGPPTSRPPA